MTINDKKPFEDDFEPFEGDFDEPLEEEEDFDEAFEEDFEEEEYEPLEEDFETFVSGLNRGLARTASEEDWTRSIDIFFQMIEDVCRRSGNPSNVLKCFVNTDGSARIMPSGAFNIEIEPPTPELARHLMNRLMRLGEQVAAIKATAAAQPLETMSTSDDDVTPPESQVVNCNININWPENESLRQMALDFKSSL